MRACNRVPGAVLCGLAAFVWLWAGPAGGTEYLDVEALKATAWWTRVQEDIRRMEYEISWQEEAGGATYHAANRAQNLRAYFRDSGVELVPRTGDANWCWGFELTGIGRDGLLLSVEDPVVVACGRLVKYIREGIVEWYENREEGLEQGFIIDRAPEGKGPLEVMGLVRGDLEIRLDAEGQSVSFLHEGAEVLRYGKLIVNDANGRELASKLVSEGNELGIVIEEEGEYPIYIDPIVTSPSWSAEGDQEEARFGTSVSGAGDVDNDGYDDVIVGAPYYDHGEEDEGVVFVYHGGPLGLSSVSSWQGEKNQAFACFGWSVSGAGDVDNDGYDDVIVGAPYYTYFEDDEGAAFVCYGSEDGITGVDDMFEIDHIDAHFGYSVSGAGDVNGDNIDDVIVGAPGYEDFFAGEGAAFVFYPSISPDFQWEAYGGQADAGFGWSVSGAGDVDGDGIGDVIVGAPLYEHGQAHEGRADVYRGRLMLGLSPAPWWSAEGNQGEAQFGFSVSGAGDVNGDGYDDVIVGAPYYDHGQDNEGRAFVYHGGELSISPTPDWTAESNQIEAQFGYSVSGAGDLDCGGNGYYDVIVGAPYYDGGEENEGRAYVYAGTPDGLLPWYSWNVQGNQPFAHLGWSVSGAGNVDNNPCGDVIVGAEAYNNGDDNEGRAFVYCGFPPPDPMESESELFMLTPGDDGIVCPGGDGSWVQVSVKSEGGEPIRGVPVTALFFTEGSVCRCDSANAVTDTNGVAQVHIFAGIDRDTTLACCVIQTVVRCLGVTIPWKGTGGALQDTREWVSPDLNGDCTVDLIDWTIFNGDYMTTACRSDFDGDGLVEDDDIVIFNIHFGHACEQVTGIEDAPRSIMGVLEQNYPNPFNPLTHVAFTIAKPGRVSLRIHDVAGRHVRTLVDESKEAGEYTVSWDGRDDRGNLVPSGVYFCTLKAPGHMSAKKMIFLR